MRDVVSNMHTTTACDRGAMNQAGFREGADRPTGRSDIRVGRSGYRNKNV
jgi:hypothetical protein